MASGIFRPGAPPVAVNAYGLTAAGSAVGAGAGMVGATGVTAGVVAELVTSPAGVTVILGCCCN